MKIDEREESKLLEWHTTEKLKSRWDFCPIPPLPQLPCKIGIQQCLTRKDANIDMSQTQKQDKLAEDDKLCESFGVEEHMRRCSNVPFDKEVEYQGCTLI